MEAAASVTTGVPLFYQQQPEWCWTTCLQMVLKKDLAAIPSQCQLVSLAYWAWAGGGGFSPCCNSPDSYPCNRPLAVDEIRDQYARWGIEAIKGDYALDFDGLVQEIQQGRPVEAGLLWEGGGGHAILIVGWVQGIDGRFFVVNDPLRGSGYVWYDDLLSAYGFGAWDWSWTHLGK